MKRKTTGPRVFSVFFHPSPRVTAVGGAEKRFRETLRILIRRGLELVVLESSPSLLKRKDASCRVYTLRNPFSPCHNWLTIYIDWVLWMIFACFRAVSIIRKTECQLVLASNNTVPNLLPAYFTHLVTRLPLCVIVHHIDVTAKNPNNGFQAIFATYREAGCASCVSFLKTLAFLAMKRMLEKADACITVSNFTAQTLACLGVEPHRICVSGNGIDQQFIRQIPTPQKKAYGAVFVGRISREKGVFDLLKAWCRIASEKRRERLLIIGSGPDLPKVQEMVVAHGLKENVVVCGAVADMKLYSLLKSSRVFVFPSRFEGWGLAVAEALASGLPVVCYDIPALREVFGECRSIFFVPLGNIRKLCDVTKKILELEQEKYDVLVHISENYARRFAWDEVARKDLWAIRKLSTN